MRRTRWILVSISLALLPWGGAAVAQERSGSGFNAILDNIDLMINSYTSMLGRKYHLTDEQAEYTRELLNAQVNDESIRYLLDRMYDVRSGGAMSQDELMTWGRQVAPLFEEAKRVIIDSNDEWRSILTDEQRVIHDEDLQLMHESFNTTSHQLQRIVTGDMSVDEFRAPPRVPARPVRRPSVQETNAPPPPPELAPQIRRPVPGGDPGQVHDGAVVQPMGDQPPQVAQPTALGRGRQGGPQGPQTQVNKANFESDWERYVREFIARFSLTEAQISQAERILKDCQERAAQIMRARASQIADLDKQIADATAAGKDSKDKDAARRITVLQEQRKKIVEPVEAIFDRDLKPRLDAIPTRAQRRAVEEAEKKQPGTVNPVRPNRPVAPPPQPQPEPQGGQSDENAKDE